MFLLLLRLLFRKRTKRFLGPRTEDGVETRPNRGQSGATMAKFATGDPAPGIDFDNAIASVPYYVYVYASGAQIR